MSTKRLLNVLIALTLAVVAAFTFYHARATPALVQADRDYDSLEQVRVERLDANLNADRSYDAIETQRLGISLATTDRSYDLVELVRTRPRAVVSDRSYDLVENLRAIRTLGG